ncbi:hypothetical protein [Dendronalium sp. ChiSLP03b]|nr:hypothetical protein [Dendronalium sp. ChiSLP03b]MDZ8205834.1 hypothetical protein [Dendronalium sp. ChiSLP03b]
MTTDLIRENQFKILEKTGISFFLFIETENILFDTNVEGDLNTDEIPF